jgi:hypothetical protein
MKKPISLIVTDTGPLITLALAGELNVLIMKTEIQVVIPDLVRFEVLRHMDKPGAREIDEWIRSNEPEAVRVASTEEHEEFMLLLSLKPNARTKGRGEAAASEVLKRELARGDRIGILLFEDGDVRRNKYTISAPNNVLMLSTAQFLKGLERLGLIHSADEILGKVVWARGLEVQNSHQHATPGAETRSDDWAEDFNP